jgi:hypothetical protein
MLRDMTGSIYVTLALGDELSRAFKRALEGKEEPQGVGKRLAPCTSCTVRVLAEQLRDKLE